MKAIKQVQSENMNLLLEIYNLKALLCELYSKKGPANSDYISFSIKLDLLIKEYIEEKMTVFSDELIEFQKQKGFLPVISRESLKDSVKLN